jgi:uncharacterized protein YbjT (DUF2867 family)
VAKISKLMDQNTHKYSAVILGATGLIGHELLKMLMVDTRYSKVHLIGRRNTDLASSKIYFHQVDMDQLDAHADLFNVDIVFCCLGSTMKNAGSKEAFYRVDFDMVVNAAKNSEGKVKHFLMVSSLGANKNSSNFYLRTKGEAEAAVSEKNIPSISILRPSILFGNRQEKRNGEKMGIAFMKAIQPILMGGLKKYRGNHATSVARTMIKLAEENKPGKLIIESTRIEEMNETVPN